MLTVIISNYNQEKHVSETIDSALAQNTSFPYKIIISDDYSCKDRSKEIIQEYARKHRNIETLFASENKGYLTNVLRALNRTNTKYFCLLDADDYWTDPFFLQRACGFLETHGEYSIFEANVEVASEDGKNKYPLVSHKCKSGTYSKEMLLNNERVPFTQTTGMVFRNSIFITGIPDIIKNAVGTRSERSFEGDAGRLMMHLKEGLAYYDSRIVGVYRLTENGIWNSLSKTQKKILSARLFFDLYQYYGTNVDFFVNKAYKYLQAYLSEKQKELIGLTRSDEFIDEYERLMFDDVYFFCKKYADEIPPEKNSLKEKIKKIVGIIRQ